MIRFFSFIRPAFNNLSYQIYIRAEWRSCTYALEHWTLDFSRNVVFRFILLVLVLQQVHQKFGPQYIPCLHMQYYSSLNIFAPTNYRILLTKYRKQAHSRSWSTFSAASTKGSSTLLSWAFPSSISATRPIEIWRQEWMQHLNAMVKFQSKQSSFCHKEALLLEAFYEGACSSLKTM